MAEVYNNCADSDIKKYIDEGKDVKHVLHEDGKWEVFRNFAPIREGLLNWYDFNRDSELLELGCEYGALTALYCRKCKYVVSVDSEEAHAEYTKKRYSNVDNLTVIHGTVEQLELERLFDYIVVMPSYYDHSLRMVLGSIKKYLKETGSMFIVADNSLGVNVMSGKTYGDEPFAEFENTGKCYISKEELRELLEKEGYTNTKWFYPMPDYVIPQEIYTDESLPNTLHTDRIVDCYPYKDTMIAQPAEIMRTVIKNKVFPQMANSFIVECKQSGEPCEVTYAALSTDRERGAAYATKIYGDKRVVKEPLYEDGQTGINRLYNNAVKLEQRGIPVIKHQLCDSVVEMPFIHDETLMQFMLRNNERQDIVEKLIERVYNYIIISSVSAPPEKNIMLHYAPDIDWGIILSEAYLDMIPFNCFYNGTEMAFFDQEFCVENCPAKYVVFRMLRYVDLSMKNAGFNFDLDRLKVRYELEEVWNYCMQEEDKFIFKNRNHEMLEHFYGWTSLLKDEIHENILRLQRKDTETKDVSDPESTQVEGLWLSFPSMFYAHESDNCGYWRWCNNKNAEVIIRNKKDTPIKVEIEFEIVFPNENEHKAMYICVDDNYWAEVLTPAKIVIPIEVTGMSDVKINLKGNLKEYHFDGDARTLLFQVRNYNVRTEPRYVDDTITEVRHIQLKLLKLVDTVCSKHGLQYFAIYGTLLGVVRNQGYIPWDDDIDIAMPRKDYEEFLDIVQKEKDIDSSVFLQNMHTDKDIFFGGYSKLRDSNSTGILKVDYGHGCNHGVWIDIFPLDNHISDSKKWNRQYRQIRHIQKLMYYKVYKHDKQCKGVAQLTFFEKLVAGVCKWDTLCVKLDKVLRRYNEVSCTDVSINSRMIAEKRMVGMEGSCFEDYELRSFEGIKVRVPILYKECLNRLYGYNYMLYPDETLRRPHTDVYYNTDVPYREECLRYRNESWENCK